MYKANSSTTRISADRNTLTRASGPFFRKEARLSRLSSPFFRATVLQREILGPGAGGPNDWDTRVQQAQSSTQRTALIQEALGRQLRVVDRTRQSENDRFPEANHLLPYSNSAKNINFDDNLASKRSRVDRRLLNINAGYLLESGGRYYIVLSPKALKRNNFFYTIQVVNHEFDHIRQMESNSSLRGSEAELDAWVTSFTRDFHRSYTIRRSSNRQNCYVNRNADFLPLQYYFVQNDVSRAQKRRACDRIIQYYRNTIRRHPAHNVVFRYWLHRSMQRRTAPEPVLVRILNRELRLGIDSNQRRNRRFDCALLNNARFSSPVVSFPRIR